MSKSTNNPFNSDSEGDIALAYLEPIPVDSFLRIRLVSLFTEAGLADFESQVLLSILCYGGKVTPKLIADDLRVSYHRVDHALTNLKNLGLVTSSTIHRPIVYKLAIPIDHLIEKLSHKSITLEANSALVGHELLIRLHKKCLSKRKTPESEDNEEENNLFQMLDYFKGLKRTAQQFDSLFILVNYALVMLKMNSDHRILLSLLIASGGKISKKGLYKKVSKSFEPTEMTISAQDAKQSLKLLGYSVEEQEKISQMMVQLFPLASDTLRISTLTQYNLLLEGINNYSFSMLGGKRPLDSQEEEQGQYYLMLTKTLEELAQNLYNICQEYEKQHQKDLQHLTKAYQNVRIEETLRHLFYSRITSIQGVTKRLVRDVEYATKIQVSYIGCNNQNTFDSLLKNTLLAILHTQNRELQVEFLVVEREKASFIQTLKKVIPNATINARGIIPEDTVSFVPFFSFPTDYLQNSFIVTYPGEQSSLSAPLTFSPTSPAIFSTLDELVDTKQKSFQQSTMEFKKQTIHLHSILPSN